MHKPKHEVTDVFAGCLPDEIAEAIWKDYPSANLSSFQMAFRKYCYRSDKKVMEAGKYDINTLASNRENLVNGPL